MAGSVPEAILLDLPGVEEPACDERSHGREDREGERIRAGQPAVVQGRPEDLDEVRHRVVPEDPAPRGRHERLVEDDRRQEEPREEDCLVHVADVDEPQGEREYDEADARGEEGPDDERHGEEKPRPMRGAPRDEDDEHERDEAQQEVHEPDEDGRRDEHGARDVDAVRDLEGVRREGADVARGLGEERPEERRRKVVHGIVGDREALELRKDEREDDHRHERAQHRPGDAEDGALVADLDVPGRELEDEVAVGPQLARLLHEAKSAAGRVVDGRAGVHRVRGVYPRGLLYFRRERPRSRRRVGLGPRREGSARARDGPRGRPRRRRRRRVAVPARTLERYDRDGACGRRVRDGASLEAPPPAGEPLTSPAPRRTTVVVLCWNRWDLTRRCLETLKAHTDLTHAEVLVVDNGSTDETPQRLREIPWVRVVTNATNLGYVRGNNAGIAAAPQDADVLLLNNDVEIHQAGWLA